MKELSVVRENLMTEKGYMPYCGNENCQGLKRAHFDLNLKQFKCSCGWISTYPRDFIDRYLTKWK